MPARAPESSADSRQLLASGLAALELSAEDSVLDAMLEYVALLAKWNKAYNLTAVRDPRQMVVKHLLDSLATVPCITGDRLLDAGTGAGLPGIPLALWFPRKQVCLLDSNGKKTRFLFQARQALGMENVTIEQARAETFAPERLFDTVIARAFASLAGMLDSCAHLLAGGGRLLAMKGEYPAAEIEVVQDRCRDIESVPLTVPGLNEQRHLIIMVPADVATG